MDKVYKFKIHCVTEDAWKDVILEDDSIAPTKCPTDTAHLVTTDSASITETLEKNHVVQQMEIPSTGGDHIFTGFNFVATKNSITTHTHKIVGNYYLHEGHIETLLDDFNDLVSIELIDIDGTYGIAGTVLKKYVKECPLTQGGITHFHSNKKTSQNLDGYYMKVTYDSKGVTNDVKCKIRITGLDL
tara:strand:+ start:22420 stop:22980 length:561 start_codon:yes stop_codon:yes gene_type:complete